MTGACARALVACGLAAFLLVGHAAALVRAAPTPKQAVTITADVIDADAATRVVTATGRVRITDGTVSATAGRATLYHAEGRAVLVDGARVVGPQGTLEGAEITMLYTTKGITRINARGKASLKIEAARVTAPALSIVPASETVTGQGGVTLVAPSGVVATGGRLTYQRARGIAVLEGEARVQNRDGFIRGDRIEGHEDLRRATVTGGVVGRFRDIEVRSRAAEIFGQDKKAVFTGDVQVTQPGRTLTTEKVTVWYEIGRIVAEGQTRVRLEGQP